MTQFEQWFELTCKQNSDLLKDLIINIKKGVILESEQEDLITFFEKEMGIKPIDPEFYSVEFENKLFMYLQTIDNSKIELPYKFFLITYIYEIFNKYIKNGYFYSQATYAEILKKFR